MLATGNGDPRVCVDNLLKTARYDVPYERIKGINTDYIDSPVAAESGDLVADAEWLIETYEPRVSVNKIDLEPDGSGGFSLIADISINELEEV